MTVSEAIGTSTTRSSPHSSGALVDLRRENGDGNAADLAIRCQPGHRLGQHTVGSNHGTRLDSYLRDMKAKTTSQLFVVTTTSPDDLRKSLAARSRSSRVVLQVVPHQDQHEDQRDFWMLDEDQLAQLIVRLGWTQVEAPSVRLCCSDWMTVVYRLSQPKPPSTDGATTPCTDEQAHRKVQDLELSPYAKAVYAVGAPALKDGNYYARPSVGNGSGRPGLECTQAQLETLRELENPDGSKRFSNLHFGSWVSVRPLDNERQRVSATLWERRACADTGLGPNEIGVGQVIRLALDVGEFEQVRLEDVSGERWARWRLNERRMPWGLRALRWGNKFAHMLAPAVHVVARVEPAELTMTEQNACLLSELAIDCLGLRSGDEIVLHSAEARKDGKNGVVHVKKRLKAYVATAEVREQRKQNTAQRKNSDPVLSTILLDDAVRTQMGLPRRGGAVIVAPSRRYVLADNLREVAIVAAVALWGVAASTHGGWRGMWAALAVVVPVGLIALRVRSKLR